ncbi:MAG: hypothetical protein J6P56_00455 [Bacteroidales bacterium]|nr:hypothetical protein [Bacteroidales bacterium]
MVHSRFISRFFFVAGAVALLASCKTEPRNTEELIDPWLRERTPVNFRLESQIGAAVISNDWRNDAVGSITVSIITGGLDLTKVKVEALDFKFPQSEFCPTANISKGSTLDLSNGSASFTVTAFNGETRTYTVTYSQFVDPLEGTYTFTPIGGLLDGSAPQCAFIIVGGWDDAVVRSTVMDKWWHWGEGYMPTDEDDNTLSFRLEKADAETGATFGSLVNTAGDDGKYANYVYNNSIDVNSKYRIFPAGKSRWGKPGDGSIVVYDYDDTDYAQPLYSVELLEAGEHTYAGVSFSVPNLAFGRSFEGPFDVIDWNWPDTRWFTDNVRNTFWLVKKDSDTPLPNHSDLLQ